MLFGQHIEANSENIKNFWDDQIETYFLVNFPLDRFFQSFCSSFFTEATTR